MSIDDLEPGQIWRGPFGATGPLREIVAIDGEVIYYRKIGLKTIQGPIGRSSFAKWAVLDVTEKKHPTRTVA